MKVPIVDSNRNAITIDAQGIRIEAGAEAGAFYGVMTVLQLLREGEVAPVALACDVTDYPDWRVLAGLGLGRIGHTVTKHDDPCIRGMVAKIIHLVSVEELEG